MSQSIETIPDTERAAAGPGGGVKILVKLGVGKFYLGGCLAPAGAEFVGTVIRDGYDSGALVRFRASGRYAQANAGSVRTLPQRETVAALAAAVEDEDQLAREPMMDLLQCPHAECVGRGYCTREIAYND